MLRMVEHVWYVEGQGNLIIEYTPEGAKGEFEGGEREGGGEGHSSFTYLLFVLSGTVAFVGSHLDMVPANPETWERKPFKLIVEVGTQLHQGMLLTSCGGCVSVLSNCKLACSCLPNHFTAGANEQLTIKLRLFTILRRT